MSCVFGNSVWRQMSSALSAFSAACCAWNAAASCRSLAESNAFAALKSTSAFVSHSRASSSTTSSRGFIDDLAVLVGRVGDAADDLLGLLKARSAHYDHVDRHA